MDQRVTAKQAGQDRVGAVVQRVNMRRILARTGGRHAGADGLSVACRFWPRSGGGPARQISCLGCFVMRSRERAGRDVPVTATRPEIPRVGSRYDYPCPTSRPNSGRLGAVWIGTGRHTVALVDGRVAGAAAG